MAVVLEQFDVTLAYELWLASPEPASPQETRLLGAMGEYIDRVLRQQSWSSSPEEREDYTSELLMKCWRALPAFKGGCDLKTWVYGVAINYLRSKHRARMSRPNLIFEDPSLLSAHPQVEAPPDHSPHPPAVFNRMEQEITRLLQETQSFARVREELGLSQLALKSHVFRMRRKVASATGSAATYVPPGGVTAA